MRKNILVLGGTGFIGHNLLKKLSKTKQHYIAFKRCKKNNINLIRNVNTCQLI